MMNQENQEVASIFSGCIPAIMTPCVSSEDRTPDYEALVRKAQELIECGMNGVVYCGSMGDWRLLTDEQRPQGHKTLAWLLNMPHMPRVSARRV